MDNFNVFGLKVSNFDMAELSNYYSKVFKEDKNIVIYGYSFGIIPSFKKNIELYEKCNSFDIMVIDGTYFYWFCFFFKFKVKHVISIPDITNFTLNYANINKLSLLLFGSNQVTNEQATTNLRKKFPNIVILKGINGYFNELEELNIVHKINLLSPHIILIGISTPIKENFAFKYKDLLNANIIIPCGGMIDVYAGKVKQTPIILKKMGFASFFRVFQEPRRLFLKNMHIFYQICFILLPLVLYNYYILRRRHFNMIFMYNSLNKKL